MNKKFEAVPYKEWLKSNPKKGTYNVLINGEKASYNFYEPEDGLFYVESDSTTHVLVAVEDEWVSVSDRLPEKGQRVLVWTKYKSRVIAMINDSQTWVVDGAGTREFDYAEKWKPLPQPPSQTNKPE